MEGRFDDIELHWINDTLDEHGDFLVDLLQEAIKDKKLIKSHDLEHSLEAKNVMYGQNPALQVSFLFRGRFIEIAWHRSKNTKNILSILHGKNTAILKQRTVRKPMRKKDTRWYAKNVYGSLNRLISILQWELSESERARIKFLLESRKIST